VLGLPPAPGTAAEAWANDSSAASAAALGVSGVFHWPSHRSRSNRGTSWFSSYRRNQTPDRHAVARAFQETPDLKRACYGLVALLGLQSAGVGAVAMRFVPVGASAEDALDGNDVIEDLERELARRLADTPRGPVRPAPTTAASPPSFGIVSKEEVPLPTLSAPGRASHKAMGFASVRISSSRPASSFLESRPSQPIGPPYRPLGEAPASAAKGSPSSPPRLQLRRLRRGPSGAVTWARPALGRSWARASQPSPLLMA
jgi:hypothetical protein